MAAVARLCRLPLMRIGVRHGSAVNDRIVIEVNGIVLKLPAETAATRIAEIVSALEARR